MKNQSWKFAITMALCWTALVVAIIFSATGHVQRLAQVAPGGPVKYTISHDHLPTISQHDDDLFPDQPKSQPKVTADDANGSPDKALDTLAPTKSKADIPADTPAKTKHKNHSNSGSHSSSGSGHSGGHSPSPQNPTSQPFAPPFSAGFGAFA